MMTSRTRIPMLAGVLAGPFFTVIWLLAALGRPNYSALRHPISSLSIGESGWVQIANFLITGLLTLAFALGIGKLLTRWGLSKWTAIFLAAVGIGLVGAGLFVTDPINGYPPGTPLVPDEFTLTSHLHSGFSALVFLGIPLAGFSVGRWFTSQGKVAWATYSRSTAWGFLGAFIITTLAFLGVAGLDGIAGLLQRFTLLIGWTWVTLFAIHLDKQLRLSADSTPMPHDVAA